MKKYFLATISALALLGGSASAADLIPEVKAAPVFYNPFAKPPAVLGRLKAVERILE